VLESRRREDPGDVPLGSAKATPLSAKAETCWTGQISSCARAMTALGVRVESGAFQWCKSTGKRSIRKQPEQLWR